MFTKLYIHKYKCSFFSINILILLQTVSNYSVTSQEILTQIFLLILHPPHPQILHEWDIEKMNHKSKKEKNRRQTCHWHERRLEYLFLK